MKLNEEDFLEISRINLNKVKLHNLNTEEFIIIEQEKWINILTKPGLEEVRQFYKEYNEKGKDNK